MSQGSSSPAQIQVDSPGSPLELVTDTDADVEDELRFHLDQRTAELEARGLPPAEARSEALRRFGDVGRVRDTCRTIESARLRRMSRLQAATDVAQDVRFATRTLLRQPLFTFAETPTGRERATCRCSPVNGEFKNAECASNLPCTGGLKHRTVVSRV